MGPAEITAEWLSSVLGADVTVVHSDRIGDGLVGPREYDWLGPLCFLAAGDAARIDALFDGYQGRPFDRSQREPLLRLLLLHRYSHLKAQIAVPGWQAAPDFTALAALAWP